MANEVAIQIDALADSIEQRLQVDIDGGSLEESQPTIYRVLPHVRQDDPKAYDPKLFSFGPLHRDKESLKSMENLKRRYLRDLLRRCPTKNTVRKYVKAISKVEARARRHYSEASKFNHEEFVEMLLLDGCFIVEYLIKRGLGKIEDRDQLKTVNWNLPLLRNDLLLLENQIPFFILQIIFDKSIIPLPLPTLESGDKDPEAVVIPVSKLEDDNSTLTLMELALNYFRRGKELQPKVDTQDVHHLLHLFHLSINPILFPDQPLPETFSCHRLVSYLFKKMKKMIYMFLIGILYFLFSIFQLVRCKRPCLPSRCSSSKVSRHPRMLPCATELKESGIQFKKKHEDCFLKVSFEHGKLEIPFLPIDESTISKFRNLIAFEQCCPNSGSYFTSYAVFMDNIINTSEDVAILRRCGIIESKLGSDDEVAQFFNMLCKGCYLDYKKHHLADLFQEVEQYCESDLHRWRAKLMHDYFSNPWAIIAFVASFLLLLLTGTQTFFAVYGYFLPPSPSASPPSQ